MKIHIEKNIEVPKGFCCENCASKKRDRRNGQMVSVCIEFSGRTKLDIAKNGNTLKCPDCLLACRESLMED